MSSSSLGCHTYPRKTEIQIWESNAKLANYNDDAIAEGEGLERLIWTDGCPSVPTIWVLPKQTHISSLQPLCVQCAHLADRIVHFLSLNNNIEDYKYERGRFQSFNFKHTCKNFFTHLLTLLLYPSVHSIVLTQIFTDDDDKSIPGIFVRPRFHPNMA